MIRILSPIGGFIIGYGISYLIPNTFPAFAITLPLCAILVIFLEYIASKQEKISEHKRRD